MIKRSLQVSSESIEVVNQALIDKFSTQQQLANALEVTRQPISKFFNGKSVASGLFVRICEKLGLEWKEIAELPGKFEPQILKNDQSYTVEVSDESENFSKVLRQYARKYTAKYGSFKLLGMQQSVPLESVYTSVQFLDSISIRQFESLEALEEVYRNSQKRRFQTRKIGDIDGMTVAQKNQYLMVLGGPGAGKTTYLRRIGLESLKGRKSKLKRRCLPVFLELKRLNTNKINFKEIIVQEFHNLGLVVSEEFVIKALENGNLLILLDGLDEVPKANLNAVVEAIQNFVNKYDKNYFIASCRIAAYQSSFERFTDIELADFDDNQIQQFINNWFHSDLDKQSETAEKCWQTLNEPSNKAAKELAQTPLLLTFLCLVYNRSQSFPTKRAALYRKALDILLEEWAAEKRIQPGEIYQGLNSDLEKVLLAEIAYHGFASDQLFFREGELVECIKNFLSDTVDKPKYLNGKAVLDAIAIQQGILVERAEDIYSFSHLTLQEYLTAQYISQDYRQVKKLVEEHLTDERWREVFLLVAGLVNYADELLELMELAAQKCINTSNLKALLNWVKQVTARQGRIIMPASKRVAILALAHELHQSFIKSLRVINIDTEKAKLEKFVKVKSEFVDESQGKNLPTITIPTLTFSVNVEYTINLWKDLFEQSDFDTAQGLIKALDSLHANNLNESITLVIDSARSLAEKRTKSGNRSIDLMRKFEKTKLLEGVDYKLLAGRLTTLRSKAPNDDQPSEIKREFAERVYKCWFAALQLQPEWMELSEDEEKALKYYLYINQLMVRCKEAAVRVSREKWQAIEERMLLISN
jgi:predicted NACHT family NTPase